MLNKIFQYLFLILTIIVIINAQSCKRSVTTASGSAFNVHKKICSGKLIFQDDFNRYDGRKWDHEITLGGGGNWEFQWYTANRTNSFTHKGKLYLRPSLTTDLYSEGFLTSGTVDLNEGPERCTNALFYGCRRDGTTTHIINPVRSARVHTKNSFSFKYGRVVIKAKLPTGDWLWPAMWLLPKADVYGGWPRSGEIDIMESRGNKNLEENGVNIGVEQFGSTLHFGPQPDANAWQTAHTVKQSPANDGFNKNFHLYEMEWTPEHLKFSLDGSEYYTIKANDGFWKRGNFPDTLENPWKDRDTMAPFDQEFYLIFNLAVGGVNGYFPDSAKNPEPKPWKNSSPHAATDFWNGRNSWLPTWNLNERGNNDIALAVDYVRVYAL